ncbi:MAG TPA: heme-binding protein [Xanthobacteraceae bacterium]
MFKLGYRAVGLSLVSALACLAAGSANAQVLAHKDISLAMATTMAMTAIESCKGQGYNVSVHVIGREGQVILGLRNDLAGPATYENSMKKAYTARTFRTPSGKFAENVKGNPTAGALFLANIVPAQGALPITIADDVIGAIGVSGAPGGDKDEACAKAGIDKVSADLK